MKTNGWARTRISENCRLKKADATTKRAMQHIALSTMTGQTYAPNARNPEQPSTAKTVVPSHLTLSWIEGFTVPQRCLKNCRCPNKNQCHRGSGRVKGASFAPCGTLYFGSLHRHGNISLSSTPTIPFKLLTKGFYVCKEWVLGVIIQFKDRNSAVNAHQCVTKSLLRCQELP